MKLNKSTSRRIFIKKSALATIGIAGAGTLTHGHETTARSIRRPASGKAKSIIFLVSDGMSAGTLAMTDNFIRYRDGRPSNWLNMYDAFPVQRGLMETASQNRVVTDSAAAASSWGCGQRVPNGRVNIDANGVEYEPVLSIAKRNGLRAGLVTTATVTHATPAGFAAIGQSRHDEHIFAKQYFDRGYDVILGGGQRFFDASQRDDGLDLPTMFQSKDFAYMTDRDGLLALSGHQQKLLGLFSDSHLPYEIDRLNSDDIGKVPSLAEMSKAALQTLHRAGDGFILQIEGARVDHAAHVNDISGLIYDQIAFDDAIAVALEYYEQNPDTLIIVTTDHGTGNPSLNGGHPLGAKTLAKIANFKSSVGSLRPALDRDSSIQMIRDHFEKFTKLVLTDDEAQAIINRLNGTWLHPYRRMNETRLTIASVLANHLEVSWSTRTHTAEFVELAALGPGSERIKPFTRNYELFDIMRKAIDIG